jgi:hypothetical protein
MFLASGKELLYRIYVKGALASFFMCVRK